MTDSVSAVSVSRSGALAGSCQVPGDKSISHRAVIFGGLARGVTEITGFLEAEDTLATCAAMRWLGARLDDPKDGFIRIEGAGGHGLQAPNHDLDMGNSGTAMRLLCGVLAGQRFASRLVGDESLTARPMTRVIKPLSLMGAKIDSDKGRPPLTITGTGTLTAISYDSPIASAQVKSAILLAGLFSKGRTLVSEPRRSRDHTERMLPQFGCPIIDINGSYGVEGGSALTGTDILVPGDPSSAAFAMVAGLLTPGSELVLRGVGANPLRTGLIEVLRLMGARVAEENSRLAGGEPICDFRVQYSPLVGLEVDPSWVPAMIDEFPVLFVAAACAEGRTTIREAQELRVKESDRIDVMTKALTQMGIQIDEMPDGAVIEGGKLQGGVTVDARGDHRCAMALAVAGSLCEKPITITGCHNIGTSYPGFVDQMNSLGMSMEAN